MIETDAHVEGAEHVVERHAALRHQPREERRHRPPRQVHAGDHRRRQHARQVVGDAAAGDVRHALDELAVEHRAHEPQIGAVRLEQRLAHGGAQFTHVAVHAEAELLEDDAARERVAVRVHPARRHADERVALGDAAAGNQALAVGGADDEAGQVVFAVGIEAGHLGRLAPQQRAAVLAAGGGHAADDLTRPRPAAGGPWPDSRERRAARRPAPGCR